MFFGLFLVKFRKAAHFEKIFTVSWEKSAKASQSKILFSWLKEVHGDRNATFKFLGTWAGRWMLLSEMYRGWARFFASDIFYRIKIFLYIFLIEGEGLNSKKFFYCHLYIRKIKSLFLLCLCQVISLKQRFDFHCTIGFGKGTLWVAYGPRGSHPYNPFPLATPKALEQPHKAPFSKYIV